MELSELYRFLRHPIQYIIYHSKDYDLLFQDSSRLSQQYADEVNKNNGLTCRNKELDVQARQLSENLSVLGRENTGLKAKLENLTAENKTINLKNDAYRKKFNEYHDRVQNSEEFKQKKVQIDDLRREKTNLEATVDKITAELENLGKIYRMQKSVISDFNAQKEYRYKEFRQEGEKLLAQIAEGDKEHSYILIGGSGRIVASTPAFREKFGFDKKDEPIGGKMYFKVLQPPKDAPDYKDPGKYVHDIKYAFRDPQEVTLETTIVDGKGRSQIIQFTKHVPYYIRIVKENKNNGDLIEKDYFYTKVDIYAIGRWEKIGDKVKKIFHMKDGHAEELHDFAERRAVNRSQEAEKKEKEYSDRMADVYAGLIFDDPKTWNVDNFLRIEKEKGRDGAEIYLEGEYSRIKNKMIGEIIGGVIKSKS